MAKIETPPARGWSVELFAAFWDHPDPNLVAPMLTPDVEGHWPWHEEPTRGPEPYVQRIAGLIELIPDLRLEVAEHASNGAFTFIRYIGYGSGAQGRFEFSGIDQIRLQDGRVAENFIRFDTARLHALIGRAPDWA